MARKKNILLVISGSVAAYKSLELIRLLQDYDISIQTVLTEGGSKFITPLLVSAISGRQTYTDMFSLKDEVEMGHIRLSREADMIVVAPASADIIAKMANGIANDLATATLLATDIEHTDIIVAPAMNCNMWKHPATQRNVQRLKDDGITIIEPESGHLACGDEGTGRMASPEAMLSVILQRLAQHEGPLKGKRAIVTTGPTHELIDPVRYIGNRSSGKQGFAIAQALDAAGADVTLVSGPTSQDSIDGVEQINVRTAEEMYQAVMSCLPADIVVCAAAVADWRPENRAEQKLKKSLLVNGRPELSLVETSDILAEVSQHETKRPDLVVGFAAETENVLKNAIDKRKKKKCDWLLANDTSNGRVFGSDYTELLFIYEGGYDSWERMSKEDAAKRLVKMIIEYFKQPSLKLAKAN